MNNLTFTDDIFDIEEKRRQSFLKGKALGAEEERTWLRKLVERKINYRIHEGYTRDHDDKIKAYENILKFLTDGEPNSFDTKKPQYKGEYVWASLEDVNQAAKMVVEERAKIREVIKDRRTYCAREETYSGSYLEALMWVEGLLKDGEAE
jgi:hypothetical protein